MAIPIVYRKTQENSIASYDAVDIINGTGYTTLYAGKVQDGASGANLVLSNLTFYSDDLETTAGNAGATQIKVIDLDFDVLINRPLTIKGNCIISAAVGFNTGAGASCSIVARLRKWDGTTETEIAVSGNSANLNSDNAVTTGRISSVNMDVPLTSFKIGQWLRITIEGWHAGTGGHPDMWLFFDPKGRTTYNGVPFTLPSNLPTTECKILLPMRIDL